MAKHVTAVTTDSATEIAQVIKPHNLTNYEATICVAGDFNGGTVTLQFSPDGGTTKIDLEDQTGTVWEATSNRVAQITLGNSSHNGDQPLLYATNSAVGTLVVTVFDNVG